MDVRRPGATTSPISRRMRDDVSFVFEGIQSAVADVENLTASATAMAILQAVTDCWREPLEDDQGALSFIRGAR
jgi:hypothetical protein